MEHLIRYASADGTDTTHIVDGLDEAVAFVERLRNTDAASDVRMFRLHELPLEFKTYYRVQLGDEAAEEIRATGAAEPAATTEPAGDVATAEPAEATPPPPPVFRAAPSAMDAPGLMGAARTVEATPGLDSRPPLETRPAAVPVFKTAEHVAPVPTAPVAAETVQHDVVQSEVSEPDAVQDQAVQDGADHQVDVQAHDQPDAPEEVPTLSGAMPGPIVATGAPQYPLAERPESASANGRRLFSRS